MDFSRASASRPDPLSPVDVRFTRGWQGGVRRRRAHRRCLGEAGSPDVACPARRGFSKTPSLVHSMQLRAISRKFRSSLSNLFFRVTAYSLGFGFALISVKHFRSGAEGKACPHHLLNKLCADGRVSLPYPCWAACSPQPSERWLPLSQRRTRQFSRQRSLCLHPQNCLKQRLLQPKPVQIVSVSFWKSR